MPEIRVKRKNMTHRYDNSTCFCPNSWIRAASPPKLRRGLLSVGDVVLAIPSVYREAGQLAGVWVASLDKLAISIVLDLAGQLTRRIHLHNQY